MLSSELFADHFNDYRLGEPGESYIPDEPLPQIPHDWTEESILLIAQWLCRPFTRSVLQVTTVLQAIPNATWPTARMVIAEQILPTYWTAFRAGDRAERRRLSALRVLIEEEDWRRNFRIQ